MLTLFIVSAFAREPADAIRDAIAERVGVPASDVEVTGIGRLESQPQDPDWVVTLPSAGPMSGDLRVIIRADESRYALVPHVVIWRQLPVAAAKAGASGRIEMTMGRVSSDRLAGSIPVAPDAAWEARVDFAPGDPVTTANARAWPDARRGADVRIVSAAGAGAAVGELLDDGFIGARVSVMDLATRAVVRGTFSAEGTVVADRR